MKLGFQGFLIIFFKISHFENFFLNAWLFTKLEEVQWVSVSTTNWLEGSQLVSDRCTWPDFWNQPYYEAPAVKCSELILSYPDCLPITEVAKSWLNRLYKKYFDFPNIFHENFPWIFHELLLKYRKELPTIKLLMQKKVFRNLWLCW